MTQPEIKIIFFDAYGVLIGVSDYREDVAKELELPIEQVIGANLKAINHPNMPSWSAVDSHEKEVEFSKAAAKGLLQELGMESTPDQIERICNLWLSRRHAAMDGVIDTLEYLRPKYKLGVISNAAPSLRTQVLPEVGLLKYFDPIVISGEIGVRKPDPDIYLDALKLANVDPEEAAFIDDSESFLDVARQLGFNQTILMDEVGDNSGEFRVIKNFRELKEAF